MISQPLIRSVSKRKIESLFVNNKSEHPQDSPEYDVVNLDNHIKNKIPNNIQFKLSDLITAMKSLDVTKARGLDGLTPKSLKTSAEIIAVALLKIINISLLNG